ncbi:unnamed protein product [Amoebophrya sp. A25]|nr:unnamed protein product [Amoebophrya sp. A25]|eukprot:GSA25T00005186001.1
MFLVQVLSAQVFSVRCVLGSDVGGFVVGFLSISVVLWLLLECDKIYKLLGIAVNFWKVATF